MNSSRAAVNRANAQESAQFSSPRQSPELTAMVIDSPASPPVVPRYHDRGQGGAEHARKRSHTGPKSPPPLSFRGFAGRIPSGPSVLSGPLSSSSGGGYREPPSTGGLSVGTSESSDFYMNGGPPSSYGGAMSASGRSSEASTRGERQYIQVQAAPSATNNFFDAVGTVRMEAFIKPMGITRYEDWIPDEADEMCLDGANGGGNHQRRRSSRSRDGRRRRSRNRGIDYTYGGMNGPPSAGMIFGTNGPPTGGSKSSKRSSGQTEVSEWGPAKGNGVQGVNGIHRVSGGDAEEWMDVQALYGGRHDPFKGF